MDWWTKHYRRAMRIIKASQNTMQASDRLAEKGLGNFHYLLEINFPKKMPTPTSAVPGSAEKIEILRQRVLRDEYLHHPDDAKLTQRIEEKIRLTVDWRDTPRVMERW